MGTDTLAGTVVFTLVQLKSSAPVTMGLKASPVLTTDSVSEMRPALDIITGSGYFSK
jgi:hypothetical protein